jgi:hypothetical protein
MLEDFSANGTYLYQDNVDAIHLQKSVLSLANKGRISVGQAWHPESPYSFAFEVIKPD